jgi:hypothetical protein
MMRTSFALHCHGFESTHDEKKKYKEFNSSLSWPLVCNFGKKRTMTTSLVCCHYGFESTCDEKKK